MNAEGNDNRQLSLNIMHWLSGLIPVERRSAGKKLAASRRSSSSSRAKGAASKQKKAAQAPASE
jgi:hypothetical protein